MKAPICLFCLLLSAPALVRADILWRADFETADLTQWHYLTNPVGLSVQSDCVYEGDWAGRVSITGAEKYLWQGNPDLNRSEFHYKPETTAEGATTYLGWSFYLPETLSEAPHEIGYWESDNTWQQQMRFSIEGEAFSFQRSAAAEPLWRRAGFATAGVWHDVAMRIHWSLDPERGAVTVWLDGEKVGTEHFATRVNDADRMFTQIGLLRRQVPGRETILIDNVRAGSEMASVLAAFETDDPVHCR